MLYAAVTRREPFGRILRHLEKWSFLKSQADPFGFGPAGCWVFENLKSEWIRSNVINRDKQVFLTDPPASASTSLPALSMRESLLVARKLSPELPLGLADIRQGVRQGDSGPCGAEVGEVVRPRLDTVLRYVALLSPSDGRQFFYRWQLQRKRWWRLFSRDPGTFSLNAEASDTQEKATVVCRYPWAEFFLETIIFHSSSWFDGLSAQDQTDFSVTVGRRRVLPHVVECLVSAELATLLYLCDSVSDRNNKTVLMFHRKICPYKFAFSLPHDCLDRTDDLLDLCKMLCLDLRRRGVATLWPQAPRKPLELQFAQNDSVGVPYSVVVFPESLTNGLVSIRDRDTTLQEEIHITDVADYGELLIKNYEIKNF